WRVEYARDSVSRCLPVRTGDGRLGERLRLRNEIWVAWMRRPLRSAWRRTWAQLGRARSAGMFWRTLADAAVGLPRALRRRRVISPAVERLCAALEAGPRELRPASFVPVMPPSRNNPST